MSFDILAPFYTWMERVSAGGKLQRCRVAYLENIPQPRHILTLGEGHGPFLAACRARFPEARIVVAEGSAPMIEQARRRLEKAGLSSPLVEFIHTDIFAWTPPPREFDLIATHFFLDCFTADQIALLVPRIAQAAAPQCAWLLADFQEASQGWRRIRSRAILAIMYVFFRVVTRLPAHRLSPPDPYLQNAGFQLQERRTYDWDLLKSDLWVKSP
jgi:ubiquinone/menaquinone biosynthesis C-methylase UbiE